MSATLKPTSLLCWGWIIKRLLFIVFFFTLSPSFAAPVDHYRGVDATNIYIATKWDQINRSVDMFFTNQESKEGDKKSSILVYASAYKKEGQKVEPEVDFQFKISLPNTTKNLKIIIEKQQDEISDALTDSSVSNSKSLSKDGKFTDKRDNQYTAGANVLLKQTKDFISSINFGIRLDMPLNPYAKLDLQKTIKGSFLDVALSQKFILYRQEGFQEISQATLTKKWNKTFQNDFINSLVWTKETGKFALRHNLILTQTINARKGLSYSVGANAQFTPTYYYNSYDASVSYRQLLHKDWLYGTWTVGADFVKENHFTDEKFVQVRVDIFFR